MDIRKALNHTKTLEMLLNAAFGCHDCTVEVIPCDDDHTWIIIRKPGLPDIDYLCNLLDGSWTTMDESVVVEKIVYDWVAEYM